jgi:histidine triad (HIT) family protein
MTDCIFCKIVNKESPAEIVFEDEGVVAFKNINPVAETHFLITPKAHVDKFMDASGEAFAKMVDAAQQVIKKNNLGEAYKLVINGGKYQAVPHLHWHLLAGKMYDTKDPINKT